MSKYLPFFIWFIFLFFSAFAQQPIISVSLDSISEVLFTGQNTQQTLTISNSGTGNLSYDISVDFPSVPQNYALQFDGIDDHVNMGSGINLANSSMTVEAWAKRSAIGTSQNICGQGPAFTNQGLHVGFCREAANLFTFAFYDNDLDTPNGYTDLDWHHWACTFYEPTKIRKIYRDGEEVANDIATADYQGDGTFYIGIASWLTSCFSGIIDEVRIWNITRTQTEIQMDITREILGTEPGLIAYWRFNEGAGNNTYDLTSNQNHGYLQNGVTWVNSTAPINPDWFTLEPDSGIVTGGASQDLTISIDAFGLDGGNYDANILISSNDPATPQLTVPVHLQVTSAPDIVTSADTLDFGGHFVGATVEKDLIISNRGFDPLIITDIISSHSDYTVTPTNFSLNPYENQEITVTFVPGSVGSLPGNLTIYSNDPDEPQYAISLFGEGLIPPSISVSPNSLSENLLSGKTSVQTLSINNSGGSDLNFEIRIGNVQGARRLLRQAIAHELQEKQPNDIVPEEIQRQSIKDYCPAGNVSSMQINNQGNESFVSNKLLTTFDLHILLITSRDYPTEIQGYLQSFPDVSVVDIFDAYSAIPTLSNLLNYDAVIVMNNPPFGNPVGLGNVLANYADAGGGVILAAASFVSGWEVQGRLLNEGYIPFNIGTGPAGSSSLGNFNINHPIMYGVTAATGDLLSDVTVASGAELIAEWNNGFPFVATKGRNVAAVNIYVTNPGYWTGDIPEILHNAVCWSTGAGWLSAEPSSGTVPANSSMEIAITFDAAGMSGGNYNADIIISNNDPITPELTVPVQLGVTDAPAISAKDDTLDFGEVFLGVSDTLQLVVENRGSMDLLIFNATVTRPEYSVDPPFAGIDPGETEEFTITFSSPVVGNYPGSIILTSNDPELGNYLVLLRGQSVEPPLIMVSPSSLYQALRPGQTANQIINIANSGGSNLNFEITSHGGMEVLVDENFDNGFPSSDFTLYSDAQYDSTEGRVYLTRIAGTGGMFYNQPIQTDIIKVNFDFEIGGGSGADGMVMAFLNTPVLGGGGEYLGFFNTSANGWGVEFDTWPNGGETENHIAVVNADGTIYITNDNIPELENTGIFSCEVYFYNGYLEVYLENMSMNYPKTRVIEYAFSSITQINEYPGFTAATGGATNNHIVDNLVYSIGETWLSVQPDSGIVPISHSGDISVSFNATDLDTGNYNATIFINSNDPLLPQVVVPIQLLVSNTVGIMQEDYTPKKFKLCQNYPNPFNPSTTIQFDLPKASKVTLKVFNVLGEEVVTLVSDRLAAGSYSYEWSTTVGIASGVYLYRLDAGNYVETRKMILMK